MSEIVFRTERLEARHWNAVEHAAGALAMYGDPEVVRFIGGKLVASEDAQRAEIEAIIGRIAKLAPGQGGWPLFERATGELVGVALLKPLPASPGHVSIGEIEIGWHLARKHWRRGFATEAGKALLVRGFEALKLPELHAVVEPPNDASLAVARRLGMRHTGATDRYYGRTLEHFVLRVEEWRGV
jgi:RimJ/RimL family protein N-acetyltransferase